jgi:rSAM/selenodomain-associated transferase 2
MISVIVPTLDEAEALPRLLRSLAAQGEAHEVIVADGGSRDDTCAFAAAAGARIVHAPRGRGEQLAAGAAAARGEIVWFVHADSRVPYSAMRALLRALDQPEIIGGNFRVLFDGGARFDRFMNWFYALIRRFGLYYGDSGIFVRRDALEAVGGVRPLALMEDYDLVRRLRRAGKTTCIAFPPLITSSRRFAGRSPPAIMAGWLLIHVLFALGVRPEVLARVYRSTVHAPGRRPPRRSAPSRIRSGRSS